MSGSSASEAPELPREESPQALVTLSASVVLTSLPTDATSVLDKYAGPSGDKIMVRFKAIGSAPILSQQVYSISADQKFAVVVKFLRRQLKYRQNESLFCYINNSFAPGLDEIIGNLTSNFAVDGKLTVSYCTTVAFG